MKCQQNLERPQQSRDPLVFTAQLAPYPPVTVEKEKAAWPLSPLPLAPLSPDKIPPESFGESSASVVPVAWLPEPARSSAAGRFGFGLLRSPWLGGRGCIPAAVGRIPAAAGRQRRHQQHRQEQRRNSPQGNRQAPSAPVLPVIKSPPAGRPARVSDYNGEIIANHASNTPLTRPPPTGQSRL